MKAEVRLFANLREAAGRESIGLVFDSPPTVSAVLDRLVLEAPVLRQILYRDGRYDERYKVLVDSNIVFPEDFGGKTGTLFAILPPVSGG